MTCRLAVLAVLALSSCVAIVGVYHGRLSGVTAQDGHPLLNSIQPCVDSAIVVGKMDRALEALTAEMVRDKIVEDEADLLKRTRRSICEGPRRFGCLIEEPAECRAGGYTLGPCKDPMTCARKRGCAVNGSFWVSRNWPPICRASWPEEPHCVQAGDPSRTVAYDSDLVHEVCEMVAAQLGLSSAAHLTAFYTGTCARATARYLEAK